MKSLARLFGAEYLDTIEALKLYEEALTTPQERLGPSNLQTGLALNNVGRCFAACAGSTEFCWRRSGRPRTASLVATTIARGGHSAAPTASSSTRTLAQVLASHPCDTMIARQITAHMAPRQRRWWNT